MPIEFAILDELGDHRPIVADFVGVGKQRMLAVWREGADRALDDVAVEVDATIVEEP